MTATPQETREPLDDPPELPIAAEHEDGNYRVEVEPGRAHYFIRAATDYDQKGKPTSFPSFEADHNAYLAVVLTEIAGTLRKLVAVLGDVGNGVWSK
jgi:hypothetical protein